MERDVTLTIPEHWLSDQTISKEDLRQALRLGLALLRHQDAPPQAAQPVIQALLRTGRVHHLAPLIEDKSPSSRQPPPTLSGTPVSELIIAQRRGEL